MKIKGKESRVDGTLLNPIFGNDRDEEGEEGAVIATKERKKVKRPPRYKVLLHNDDYTTMEFVIFILQHCFSKTLEEAQNVMLKVHHEGVGVCGVYTHEIAESKARKVEELAEQNSFPLKCSIEPE